MPETRPLSFCCCSCCNVSSWDFLEGVCLIKKLCLSIDCFLLFSFSVVISKNGSCIRRIGRERHRQTLSSLYTYIDTSLGIFILPHRLSSCMDREYTENVFHISYKYVFSLIQVFIKIIKRLSPCLARGNYWSTLTSTCSTNVQSFLKYYNP